MLVPPARQAEAYLRAAAGRNPGPWVEHSRVAAGAARALGAGLPGVDPETAYVLGLLHDIGRGAGGPGVHPFPGRSLRSLDPGGGPGVADVRHILDGYALLQRDGFADAARICLTHSFPIKDVDAFATAWECPAAERRFVQDFLQRTHYDRYDRLIQLCDALSLPGGCCLLEKRLVDVALRHGVNALTVAKWRAFLEIKEEREGLLGGSIYARLPGVVERTFGLP
jgi:hypothetical protein